MSSGEGMNAFLPLLRSRCVTLPDTPPPLAGRLWRGSARTADQLPTRVEVATSGYVRTVSNAERHHCRSYHDIDRTSPWMADSL